MIDCNYHIWIIKTNGHVGCSRCDFDFTDETAALLKAIRDPTPRCPWDIPLDEKCPVHDVALRDCPRPEPA